MTVDRSAAATRIAASHHASRRRRLGVVGRIGLMAKVGVAMAFYDRSKTVGTLLGVVFAAVLVNQQIGTFLGLVQKNTMYVDSAVADVWIAPPATTQLQAGAPLSIGALAQARTAPGVAWAEPMVLGVALLKRPDGGNEQVSLVGAELPRLAGGPWNVVLGDPSILSMPDAVFMEDSQREQFGGLNPGSVRELNGRRVTIEGFTWGLLPFAPAFAFAEIDLARQILGVAQDETSFVLVGVEPGVSPEAVRDELQRRVPNSRVMVRDEYRDSIVDYLLTETAIGITFGTSAAFGLIVGFVIVALSMFSAVVDNIREFGTLKAIGARMSDLVVLLVVQAVTYAMIGSTIGLFLAVQMSEGIRSPGLALVMPPWLLGTSAGAMVILCVVASTLALLRVRRVEPGMVFR